MHFRIDRFRPRAFLALLLACLLVQGTAVQNHVHFSRTASYVSALTGAKAVQRATVGKDADTADCLLCQQVAVAGSYLLPQAAVLTGPLAVAPCMAGAVLRAFNPAAPVHAWRSRAPPQ